ncbi:MAG: hypothetical protein IPJ88_06525 [Myxococcales bacterium]|nr:MAG: hypothetical protein IPJ88_06525 [Myxococcales bacterium]
MTSVLPMLRASVHLPMLTVAGQWGMSYTDTSGGGVSDSTTVLSNPQLMGYWNLDLKILELSIGGGVVLPTVGAPSNTDAIALLRGATARAMRDIWLWSAQTMSIILPSARADISLIPSLLYLSGDLEVAAMVPTADTDARDVEFVLQYGAALGVQILPMLRAGLRLQAVAFLSDYQVLGDSFYSAIEPFVRVNLGPLYATAHFLMNLDAYPSNVGDSNMWSARLSLGGGIPSL